MKNDRFSTLRDIGVPSPLRCTLAAAIVALVTLPAIPAQAAAAPVAAPAPAAPAPAPAPTRVASPPDTLASLAAALLPQAPGLRPEVLQLGLKAMSTAARKGLIGRKDLLTVIDYSLPSNQPRLFTFDLTSKRLLFRELVAHGKNSGDNETTRFSNDPDSLETSLGLFVTAGTYFGRDGYSLRLQGLDKGFNDLAMSRRIVLHGASYVSDATARLLGRIGRSFGCPAVPKDVAPTMIDALKNGTAIFAYYPDPQFLHSSAFLSD